MTNVQRQYDRMMLRSAFQSMFWGVLLARKQEMGLTLKGLADKLGIDKSYVSRSFSSPPNWQIDKLADMADALDVEIEIAARDVKTGKVYTPVGVREVVSTSTRVPYVVKNISEAVRTDQSMSSPQNVSL
jgi:transcriptional regulator with XRE-family HTH domain